MFKAFVTGTDANGLRNTVRHLGLKQSVSSHFSLYLLYVLREMDRFFVLINFDYPPRLSCYGKGVQQIQARYFCDYLSQAFH